MAANEDQQKEDGDIKEPAHHARRPMNAFLIFCKRHRAAVRSAFPQLENRAVTRVLGEWWATLQPEQKRCYTNLAQEYKDAFLNANPDFKWYKLPAPPLRTLSTRPTNKKSESSSSTGDGMNDDFETAYTDLVKREDEEDGIQPGKLADESQIGGLSSLFTPQKSQPVKQGETQEGDDAPKPPKKRFVEAPYNEEQKRECKADLFGDKQEDKSESNNNECLLNADDEKSRTNEFLENNGASDESNFRSERSCKGLRYQKFLAEQIRSVGATGYQNKRRRGVVGNHSNDECSNERRNSISSTISDERIDSTSESGNSSRGELEHFVESAESTMEASKPEDTETEGAESHLDYGAWSRKRFKAEDFNLEMKIEALPSLSLQEFQDRKKQQRLKKNKIIQKINDGSRKKLGQSSTSFDRNATEAARKLQEEAERALLVGSQKRKARKQSITHNAAAGSSKEDQDSSKQWCSPPPDLAALDCLATVAANRTKLTK